MRELLLETFDLTVSFGRRTLTSMTARFSIDAIPEAPRHTPIQLTCFQYCDVDGAMSVGVRGRRNDKWAHIKYLSDQDPTFLTVATAMREALAVRHPTAVTALNELVKREPRS